MGVLQLPVHLVWQTQVETSSSPALSILIDTLKSGIRHKVCWVCTRGVTTRASNSGPQAHVHTVAIGHGAARRDTGVAASGTADGTPSGTTGGACACACSGEAEIGTWSSWLSHTGLNALVPGGSSSCILEKGRCAGRPARAQQPALARRMWRRAHRHPTSTASATIRRTTGTIVSSVEHSPATNE